MFNSTTIAIMVIFCYLSATITIFTAIYHFYSMYNHNKITYSISIKLSIPFIILGFLTHLALILQSIPSISTLSFCKFMIYTAPALYLSFKLFMYLILTHRAKEYFSNSSLAFTSWKLNIWQVIAIIWSIINTIAFIPYSLAKVSQDPTEIPQCKNIVEPPIFISLSWLLLDIIGGAGASYLLIRPLLKMYNLEKTSKIDVQSDLKCVTSEFKRIAKKQAILSGISVGTSWAAIIALIFDGMGDKQQGEQMVFISLDVTVSILSIILIYSWNEWVFDKLSFCCCCIVKVPEKLSLKNMSSMTSNTKDVSHTTKDMAHLEVVVKESEIARGKENNISNISHTMESVGTVSTEYNTAIIH